MKKGKKIKRKLAHIFEFPDEVLLTPIRIVLYDFAHMAIDGCIGVIKYTDERIIIKLTKGAVCIDGAELKIDDLERGKVFISGKIDKLERLD